ncbi:DUF7344 domain-containing protein [Halomarina oriensis]|uniref:DUF7344 domain-containing protein n=1 Tax=Halomarina oriensis TaxID=671145 RepID=A0A6B0GPD6_9EURY|nr:hypothetical protein [Halomarina oriensis]MWG36684.1 hypothetical protein [Halomarina oriensis]
MNQLRQIQVVLRSVLVPVTLRDASISTTEAFDMLRQRRRQHIIRYLTEVEGTATLRDLSEHLATVEGCGRKRIYIALYQNHLPKLADVGAVHYQRRSGVITATTTTRFLWLVLRGAKWILAE